MRVLFAEDDPTLASVVVEALTDEGHQVTHVASAEQALQLAREGSAAWDAVVLDSFGHGYGELDEFTRGLLATLAAYAPVVLATGRPWARTAQPVDLGVAAILPKPYDLDTISDALGALAGVAAPIHAT